MSTALRQHFEELAPLTDAEFAEILPYFTNRRFKKHQFVVQEGNTVELEFFVLKGLLKAAFVNEEGKEYIVQFAMENWWISDYQALTTHTPATLNIICLEDVELLCLSHANKNRLCANFHKLEHFFRLKTVSGYIHLQKRVLGLLNNDAQARYQQLLAQYPTLFQRVPKAVIAAYLGVSRETLSRFRT